MTDTVYRAPNEEECFFAAALEKECLSTAWTEKQILNLPENACYICAFRENSLCGCISAYYVADEAQIINLCVSEKMRNTGVGTGLMSYIEKTAREKGCAFISLEAAENNAAAIGLYEKLMFHPVGKRKNFYGGTDAVIMEKTL